MPDKVFKEMVVRILTRFESRIEELREHFNRVRKCNKNQRWRIK